METEKKKKKKEEGGMCRGEEGRNEKKWTKRQSVMKSADSAMTGHGMERERSPGN